MKLPKLYQVKTRHSRVYQRSWLLSAVTSNVGVVASLQQISTEYRKYCPLALCYRWQSYNVFCRWKYLIRYHLLISARRSNKKVEVESAENLQSFKWVFLLLLHCTVLLFKLFQLRRCDLSQTNCHKIHLLQTMHQLTYIQGRCHKT